MVHNSKEIRSTGFIPEGTPFNMQQFRLIDQDLTYPTGEETSTLGVNRPSLSFS